MAILRGGRRIGNFDIRLGMPRDKSLADVAGDPRLQKKTWWIWCTTKISVTDKSKVKVWQDQIGFTS